ncbi:MAG: S9 family peptidase [Firmicutes bacterium]|nr:S9 family peptidase [Bacillota bacterium]
MQRNRRHLCVFSLLLLTLLAAPAGQAQSALTPHDIARLRNVSSAEISPDGRHIAYVLSVPRLPLEDPDGPAWAELHVTDVAGQSRPFITGPVNVGSIGWTRDGKAISFLARRSGDRTRALYVIPLDGGEARKVLEHETNILAYSFSPDGKRVAFLATEALPEAKKKLREQGFNQEIYEEDVPYVRVWIAELGSKEKPRKLNLPGSAHDVIWSPGDDRLAVVLAPTPLVDDGLMQKRLHIAHIEGAEVKVLKKVENPGKLGKVVWSPDGRRLAMISAADIHDPAEGRLMVVDASTGQFRDLLPGYLGHVSDIAWQDKDTLMFLGEEGVWTTFNEIRADGSGRKVILPAGGLILTGFSLSRDGTAAALLGQLPEHPTELFTMKHGDPGPRRLTNSNPWLAERRLAKQEVVKFKARDGLELEGLLIRPLDERPNTRYPLILVVHGGPEAHFRNGWLTSYSNPGQMAAGRGFAVFYPNYRGSTGRGVEFSKLSQGDPAGKEFDDLVDAVDHLIATGLVDRDRVGITGGSYGGYASAWGATYYSERFAASVMFVGISNEVSKLGTTDIPWEMYYVHFRYWPWEKWQHVLERSPIYHAGKSRTPTLILGGTEDPRVHPSQSLEMYRHLKLRSQAPVRLVRYPGEEHGNRRAASRLDYCLRMLQWMEHYLKGPGGSPPPSELDYTEPKQK